MRKYPSPDGKLLRESIAEVEEISPENILVTNGSDEGLAILFKAILEKKDKLIMPYPTYSLYPVLADIQMNKIEIEKVPLLENLHLPFSELKKRKGKFMTFASPNAPTGILEKKEELIELVKSFPGMVLCDEAYIDFAPEDSSLIREATHLENLVVSRTFSKSYSLAGLRVGYLVSTKENITLLKKIKDSYNLGMLEQAIACEAVRDREYFFLCRRKVLKTRETSRKCLEDLGFTVIPSDANFLFVMPPKGFTAEELFLYLKEQNILIRYFSEGTTSKYLRISIGIQEEMQVLHEKLKEYLKRH